MKEENIKISRRLMALLVAGGISMAPIPGSALTDNSRDPGTFVKYVEQDETTEYGEYIVKEGDNLSRISEKVCSHLRIEITPKYWPALAFLNGYPRVIKPGESIIFPKTDDKLIELNERLQEIGWTSRYKQTYKVYGIKKPKKPLSMLSVGGLLYEIYGPEVCVDEDFIRLYLEIQGLDDSYYLTDRDGLDNDTVFKLTDWIPTLDELKQYRKENKPKTKVKK